MGASGEEGKKAMAGNWLEQPCVMVAPLTDVSKTETEAG